MTTKRTGEKKPLHPAFIEMLGRRTNPYSPTAYVLGMSSRKFIDIELPALDHPTCWVKNGRRLVISEPYGISFKELQEMLAFAEKHGLECKIDARFQSWNPGHCEAVLWCKKGEGLYKG